MGTAFIGGGILLLCMCGTLAAGTPARPVQKIATTRPQIRLNGEWGFIPDVGDSNIKQTAKPLEKIKVPGAWQTQGFGTPGGELRMGGETIKADYLAHNLTARCLYVRDAEIPADWKGKRVWLVIRRAFQYTDAEVNGKRVGEYEGFSTPFEFDITSAVRFGASNRIVLGVDNRLREGRELRSASNYACNWGGIAGDVYLEPRDAVWVHDIFAIPDIKKGMATIRVTVSAKNRLPESLKLSAEISPWKGSSVSGKASVTYSGTGDRVTLDIPVKLKSFKLWSPDHPNLYTAKVTLDSGDVASVRFGMRQIELVGNKILLNGKPIYLAGYGDDSAEPLTGMPPADKAVYVKRLKMMRNMGFNYVRHHSTIPQDAYLDAADELGMIIQPEGPVIYSGYMKTGGKLFEQEWPRIITAFRNHPCILDWCMGNEFKLDQIGDTMEIIRKAYHLAHEMDPTRAVNTHDGGTINDPTDFANLGALTSDANKPTIKHEFGDYCCSLPDFSMIDRLKDSPIQPVTYRRAKAYVDAKGLGEVYPSLLASSYQMLRDANKHYMEHARLGLPCGYGAAENVGYSYWLVTDFWDCPEGCWDEGILNQLWEPKPIVKDTITQYNAPTVILTDVEMGKRTFYSDEDKAAGLVISHFGDSPLNGCVLQWRITDGDKAVDEGAFTGVDLKIGDRKSIGTVKIPAPKSAEPKAFVLRASLVCAGKVINENSWTFCAYPRSAAQTIPGVYSEIGALPGARALAATDPIPDDVRLLITNRLSNDRHARLLQTGKVGIILCEPDQISGAKGKSDGDTYFLNAWGGAFGAIINGHPVLREIPHNGRLDPIMYGLVTHSKLYPLDEMPQPFADGCSVFGLDLTGWISVVKDLMRVTMLSDIVCDNDLHLLLSGLDVTEDCPESRFVLGRMIDYMLSNKAASSAAKCRLVDLTGLSK